VNGLQVAALASHLWQSTLFAAGVGCLTLLLRNNSARVRYLLWLAGSVKFLVPFALLTALGAQIPWPFDPIHATEPSVLSSAGHMGAQITHFGGNGSGALTHLTHAVSYGNLALLSFEALWALGALGVAARWLTRWWLVRRALHESTATSLPFVVPVRSSASQLEPAVVGIVSPVLLLPKGMEERLPADEMRAVLAHERCHVAWRDNLGAALHMLVETVFWFHPLIWWLGKQLVAERELACDEHVLADGHSPESYAEGILKVCEHYLAVPLPCVAATSGGNLRQRIEGILQHRMIERLSRTRRLLITLAASATIAIPVAVGVLTSPHARAAQVQSPGADVPRFRNVSIQFAQPDRAGPPPGLFPFADGSFWVVRGGRVLMGHSSMRRFVANAYGVADSQVVGRDWSQEPRYDITVDDPGATNPRFPFESPERVRAMTRDLLTRYFGLAVSTERKRIDGYVLAISPGGSQLKPYGGGPAYKAGGPMDPGDGVDLTDRPIGTLVDFLQRMFKVPVVDQTGLQGRYEYKVSWKSSSPGTPADPETVARALQEQLGLRLEARRMTMDVIKVVSLKPPQEIVTTHP